MNIYFTTSIRALGKFQKNLDKIYGSIKNLGHECIGNYPFKTTAEELYSNNLNENIQLFNKMEKFVKECDIVVFEVSKHSVSMGYVIMKTLSMKKPAIALHTKENSPAFLVGIEDENFQLIEYHPDSLKRTLEGAIEFAKDTGDIRFNMMLSPKLSTYLKEAATEEGISKATFIRQLLKEKRSKAQAETQYSSFD